MSATTQPTFTITIPITLTTEFLSDILTTAFDADFGGCWYWAEPYAKKGDDDPWHIDADGNTWLSVTVAEKEASGDRRKAKRVDHAMLVQGIKKLFEPGILPGRGDIRSAVQNLDAGHIDADAADVLVQLGFFGTTVYG